MTSKFPAEPTRVVRRSAIGLTAIPYEPAEPPLEPLIPAEVSFNMKAFAEWNETLVVTLVEALAKKEG